MPRLRLNRLEERCTPATFTVTNLLDSGMGSLRAAVSGANGFAGADSVVFQPGLAGVITLTTGQIDITQDLAIIGGPIVVSGNKNSRIFECTGAPNGAKITFIGMILQNGKAAGDGGAISAGDEDLLLSGCTITGCQTIGTGADGGAIAVQTGSLILASSTLSANDSDDDGGAVFLGTGTTATITNCSITNNLADSEGGAVHSVSGSLTISNSSINGNTAGFGGAVGFRGVVGADGLIIRNSTFSGNSSGGPGGAIGLVSMSGKLTVQNSTITGNSAGQFGGGGIGLYTGNGLIDIESSIVSGNSDSSPSANDDLYSLHTVMARFSAIGTKNGVTTFTGDATTNSLLGQNLKLGSLAANGGTGGQTHVPAPDSPVINKGSNPAALTNDQRGSTTTREANGTADIGSVELQVFFVTNTNDSGSGSLRTAINNANNFGGFDTVGFDASVFSALKTIKLSTGEVTLEEALTISGPPARVAVDGNNTSRIFNVFDTAPLSSSIVLQNLNLTNAKSATGGGAIFASQVFLTLQNCLITNCDAGTDGGAIFIRATQSHLVIEDSTLSGNTATQGGAIASFLGAPITIRRSTLSGNISDLEGGGIYVIGANTIVEASTLSGNISHSSAGNNGGGAIYFTSTPTFTLTVSNSTISGNQAPSSDGGGIFLDGIAGVAPAIIRNSTITKNSAGGEGGGIAGSDASVTFTSTIVAQNVNSAAPDLSFVQATSVTSNNSIIGVVDAGNFSVIGSNNSTGTKALPVNAKLGNLADNGGPTFTHALLAGSPAINEGSNTTGLVNDQRGPSFLRAHPTNDPDIGAYEVQAPPTVVSVKVNDGQPQRSRVTRLTITFSQIVTLSGTPGSVFPFKRQLDNATPALIASVDNSGGPGTVVTLTFTGTTAVEAGSLADGRYTLTILSAKVTTADGSLDGNGNGTGGDNFTLVGSPANGLFRLFGDSDGNGAVNAQDFAAFRSVFGVSGPSIFDQNGDDLTNAVDFGQFRARFGTII